MKRVPTSATLTKAATALYAASAVLGPACDSTHSAHDVLHYANPTVDLHANAMLGAINLDFETCRWVPLLFGGAGVVLGVSHPLLDRADALPPRPPPGWRTVLLAISCFVIAYWLSGELAQAAAARGDLELTSHLRSVDLPLAVNAAAIFGIFERTPGGLFMALLTGVVGPLVEIGLINGLHLYHYTHPDVAGIPSWITYVYAAGSPAVGALGRQVLSELEAAESPADSDTYVP